MNFGLMCEHNYARRFRSSTMPVSHATPTSGVVLSTACAAADEVFVVTVLSNACADPDLAMHEVLMKPCESVAGT